jgi:hypothetical protein
MNGYASASIAATQLTPLTAPQSTTNADGATAAAAQAAETPTGNVQSTLSSAASGASGSSSFQSLSSYLAGLLSGTDNSAVGTFLQSNLSGTTLVNGALAGGPFNPQFILGTIAGFNFLWKADEAAAGAATLSGTGQLSGLGSAALVSAGPAGLGAAGPVGVGHARLVGALSVPPSWASAANISPAAAPLPATGLGDIGTSPVGGPGGVAPMGATGGRRRRAIPKYGFRPVVMPRPPAAG